MGWKITCIIANERDPGYLGTGPIHSEAEGREILRKLKVPVTVGSSRAFFGSGIDAIDFRRTFCMGAYDGAVLIAGLPDLIGTIEREHNEFIERFVSRFSSATVFAFDLNSGTNYFAYVLYEKSVLRRKACGDAERGVVINEGALLPEEIDVLKEQEDRDRDLVEHGEDLAFTICKRFFGCRFDEFDGEKLHVEIERLLPAFFQLSRRFFRKLGLPNA